MLPAAAIRVGSQSTTCIRPLKVAPGPAAGSRLLLVLWTKDTARFPPGMWTQENYIYLEEEEVEEEVEEVEEEEVEVEEEEEEEEVEEELYITRRRRK